ncbi:MAG: hypothetical protein BMS9Abin37_1719 [Acidobacteriota bacterium]|nr:MAG: hypothetical protein BMS9Abin37_1719 [Acidobacteriota bacterium]
MPVAVRPKSHTYFAWGLTLVLAIVVACIAAWNLKPPTPRPVTRLPLLLPPGDRFTREGRHVVAFSPDGTHLVYCANDQLYLRTMDQMEATPIRGTQDGGRSPSFLPMGAGWVFGQMAN